MNILVTYADVVDGHLLATVTAKARHANIEISVRCPSPPEIDAYESAYDIALTFLDPA